MFWSLAPKHVGFGPVLTRMEPLPPALEEVLTAGLPGSPLVIFDFTTKICRRLTDGWHFLATKHFFSQGRYIVFRHIAIAHFVDYCVVYT